MARTDFYLGWNKDQERRDLLWKNHTPFDWTRLRAASPLPEFDPRPVLAPPKDQMQTSECVAFSGALLGELLNWIKTQGALIRFSEPHRYITSQERSQPPTTGSDDGALIQGSIDSMRMDGFALSETMPFTGSYVPQVTQAARDQGLLHKINNYAHIDGYNSAFTWLSLGIGCIQIGIPVCDSFMQLTGKDCILDESGFKGSVKGGHALAIIGYVARKDAQGRNYLILQNSWASVWGDQGCCLVDPATFDRICKSQKCEVWGITDLTSYEDASGRLDFSGFHI